MALADVVDAHIERRLTHAQQLKGVREEAQFGGSPAERIALSVLERDVDPLGLGAQEVGLIGAFELLSC